MNRRARRREVRPRRLNARRRATAALMDFKCRRRRRAARGRRVALTDGLAGVGWAKPPRRRGTGRCHRRPGGQGRCPKRSAVKGESGGIGYICWLILSKNGRIIVVEMFAFVCLICVYAQASQGHLYAMVFQMRGFM